jgi:hypothetical protein
LWFRLLRVQIPSATPLFILLLQESNSGSNRRKKQKPQPQNKLIGYINNAWNIAVEKGLLASPLGMKGFYHSKKTEAPAFGS